MLSMGIETVSKNITLDKAQKEILFPHSFVVVDIETTGLSPLKNEIIELSAIKIVHHEVKDIFTTLIKPKGKISGFITGLTGISNAMVEKQPKIEDVIESFYQFTKDSIILGHNVRFDVSFIKANCKKILDKDFSNQTLDTLKIAKKIIPSMPNYKLETLANSYGISTKGHHRSLADCEMTFKVFECLKNEIE